MQISESILRMVMWVIHGKRCVYTGVHLFDPAMMEIDHIFSRKVLAGPDAHLAQRTYGTESLSSPDDLRNRVPAYGPLNRQKWDRWRPEEQVHLFPSDWRDLGLPPPLGAPETSWSLGALIPRGIAAARARHGDVVRELEAYSRSRAIRDLTEPGDGAARDVTWRNLDRPSGPFPVIPPYAAEGIARTSTPGVEATLYLPRYPGQRGYGWIRFSRPELRDVLLTPGHAELVRLLRPRAARLGSAAETLDAGKQFGWVNLPLTPGERSELGSVLMALSTLFLAALSATEDTMLRASRFPYGENGYRIVEMRHDTWHAFARFAETRPGGSGPLGGWQLEPVSNTAIRVVAPAGADEMPLPRALLTTSWVAPPLPPAAGHGASLWVALDWHPHPPGVQESVDDDGEPVLDGLWTAEDAHEWWWTCAAPMFARATTSGRNTESIAPDVLFRASALPLHLDRLAAPFVSYPAYRKAVEALADRVSPNPGYLRPEHELGVYQHLRWCIARLPATPAQSEVLKSVRRPGTETVEDALDAAMQAAAAGESANAPAVQFALQALADLLAETPAGIDEEEMVRNGRAHLGSLFLAAGANRLWKRFAERPW